MGVRPNSSEKTPLWQCFALEHLEVTLSRGVTLAHIARTLSQGLEASFKRGKGEVGMDEYQVRTWQGWHHHIALSLMAVWFLVGESHRGQQVTPALTLPQVRRSIYSGL